MENYTGACNNPYRGNLNDLLLLLSAKVPPTGFGLGSIGQGQNRVNGLALCDGDVSSTECKTFWNDNCMVKYSSTKFFGDIDNQTKLYMYNAQAVDHPTSFNMKVKALLSSLSGKAYADTKFYATGELDLGASKILLGLAQCTRDLSSMDYKKCLDVAVGGLPSCSDGKRGGRVVGGSSNVRYELYPFVETGKKGRS
ncbi:PREDICTED: cysteine-rich repeat secretory protein 38-like [Populus euphratica]|uniref:Cysteine-rich repeat secretory protein 38-like n=1 Tax=Populus euphratica TaxID=75702 RepID=A0AAJ6UXH3_POPEU|nr:PREDICTED: cysteine-rich repeat secretory protein 38-like [Populus euphratica]